MSSSFLLLFSLAMPFSIASDFCAWNRAETPVDENNAATYNFLNGEFNRDTSTTYGDTWQGMPYYKMEIESCYVPTLWLYRHIDYSSYPPQNHWVIASGLGTKPSYGYAYCGPDSGANTDPASPAGDCDGNWMIGDAEDASSGQTAGHVLDPFFKVMVGGCQEVACAQLTFYSQSGAFWTTDGEGVFSYDSSNVYKQTNSDSETGFFYLFWNHKAWRWAVDEYIDEYNDCEQYKSNKGFTSVANVNEGDATASGLNVTSGDTWYYLTPTGSSIEYIECSGSVPTPSPTAADTPIPTAAPVDPYEGICDIDWQAGAIKDYCDAIAATPAPVTIVQLTSSPTADTTADPDVTWVISDPPTNDQGYPANTPSPTTAGSNGGNTDDSNDDNSGCYKTGVQEMLFCVVAVLIQLMR